MSIKQIRIVKIVRMILMSIYFYFIWRIPKSDEHFFIIATTSVAQIVYEYSDN